MAQEDINQIRNIYFKLKGGVFNFKGSSMEPVLKEGDILRVLPINTANIRAGDIVVFNRNVLVCHRILGRFKRDDKLCFLEKGDNSSGAGYISYEDIIGRVKYIITKNGLKKPPFVIFRKNILFFALDIFMGIYIEFSDFLKNKLFLGKSNKFLKFLGTIIWRVYYFYFKLIVKDRFSAAGSVFFSVTPK
ncbi:MAG: signal peptidase I [Candidatus Omnitrophica bacterium CG11_big_fil_rev_8_21_14_0_20_42_13]|uniref:Signal peptidase I n=1 Tax=Candidatus Ghiorseimicrobium undicola TaxID=1974746 RepID=A0A2H0M057_9BACT|nr:MAG: signal peptidase I [Candidatus Omnitrophica bacterium CG11_big_fil_rev_8_21_14_0_20_42_13]